MNEQMAVAKSMGLLGLIFVLLKLTSQVAWSWWFVLSPFWFPPVFTLCIFVLLVIIEKIAEFFEK